MDSKYIPSLFTIIKECKAFAGKMGSLSEAIKRVSAKKVNTKDDAISKLNKKFQTQLKKIEKTQTISIQKIIELNNRGSMPILVKHCVVAVQPKLKGEGRMPSFIGAHNICFWSLKRYNLINKRTDNLTSRGKLREKYHRSKDDPIRNGLKGSAKTNKYNKLFNSIFKKALR